MLRPATTDTNITQAAALLKSCDACWQNFRTILCQQMCSPDQSTFMEASSGGGGGEVEGRGPGSEMGTGVGLSSGAGVAGASSRSGVAWQVK